ncbi:type 1 glutamine amidotransferase [Gordonia rubripertincta]|uniref:type 1 glutamine amidotransferase n=1 Tax=Gordonia rubripertincta TaxID=36822 RepID=UPI000B8DBC13|nr:type 1 glutamine amidotransferase [Gordonia rubripertincta]ASR05368.1 glutamine amidotransferase [Gordonia rubripertincta]
MSARELSVITHVNKPSIGVLEEAATAGDWTMSVVGPFRGDRLPDLDAVEALVVLGGPQSAYDVENHPYLVDEIAYLRDAHAREIPVLGLCLGSQLLADALGGGSRLGDSGLECGFIDVTAVDDKSPLHGRFFSFHSDSADPPADAEVLARSDRYLQAWRLGTSTAIQFHPELDGPGIEALLALEGPKLRQYGVDVDAIRDAIPAGGPQPGRRLLDVWLDDVPARNPVHRSDSASAQPHSHPRRIP